LLSIYTRKITIFFNYILDLRPLLVENPHFMIDLFFLLVIKKLIMFAVPVYQASYHARILGGNDIIIETIGVEEA